MRGADSLPQSLRRLRTAAVVAVGFLLAVTGVSSMPAYADGTPSAPTGAMAVPGDGSVTVSFIDSASQGASPILYYRVSVFLNGHDTDYRADGTTSPITVTGLPNGVPFTAKVKARNAGGFGKSSKPTPAFVPTVDGSSTPQPAATTTPPAPSPDAPPPLPPSASPTGTQLLPGDLLDLRTWRLGLPTDSTGRPSGTSLEIKQPQLLTYTDDSFFVNAGGDGVVFRAGVAGATTPNSRYPRSELRELAPSGALAAWTVASGTHTMTLTGSVDHLPVNKPQVIAAQIHSTHGFLPLLVMASGSCGSPYCNSRYAAIPPGSVQLVARENGDQQTDVVDPGYALGSRYTLRIQVTAGGTATIEYRNLATGYTSTHSFTITSDDTQYFKAGCYTQSNLQRDAPAAFGQTTINGLTVTHTA